MTPEQRQTLLEQLASLAHREAENVSQVARFLPLPAHRLALRPEIVVIRGGRGAGKSALFKLLDELKSSTELREFFGDQDIPDATWIDAFAQTGMRHPEVGILDAIASADASDGTLRAFWLTHLVRRISEEIESVRPLLGSVRGLLDEPIAQVQNWARRAESNLGEVSSALDAVEVHLRQHNTRVFASYDHLDRIGAFDPVIRRRYIAALLALWLSLSNRYQNLRAKVFLREDLFEAGELRFPDASKLRPRSVAIEWDVESLYRVLVRHLAQHAEMRKWLLGIRKPGARGLGLDITNRGAHGWMPGSMQEPLQKALADHLAGELMGQGVKKGFTYRWIPNRLQDANVRIVPRSMLCLIGFAAGEAQKRPLTGGERLILPANLVAALEETSRARVGEVTEEYPLARRIENLHGLIVPMSREEATRQLGKPSRSESVAHAPEAKLVVDELVRLGVLSIRPDGRVDVPDIYRYGYRIKRKGGVRRPR